MSTPMTVEGEKALRTELEELKTDVRPALSKAIGSAREHGDLKENAEYHAAREKQSFVEGRIMEIEQWLAGALVIDIRSIKPNGKVLFGATVELIDKDDHIKVYRIVGEDQADPQAGLISVLSPLAKNLIGKQVDEAVEFKVSDRDMFYTIRSIQHL